MPTKNEDWILPITLKAAENIADIIIIGDQMSTDGTRKLLASSDKVHIFDNTEIGHSNKIRWKMLDYMREHFGNDNLVICLDADEILPPYLFNKHKALLLDNIEPGTIISSPWVQTWRDIMLWRNDDSIWDPATNKKPFIFLDNGTMDYNRSYVINDHTSRVPQGAGETVEMRIPLIHLQFANWNRMQIKQAWYQCCEVIKGGNPLQITQSYSIMRDNREMVTYENIPEVWYRGVEISIEMGQRIMSCDVSKTWYYKEMVDMFEKHGIETFRQLDIWHIPALKSIVG